MTSNATPPRPAITEERAIALTLERLGLSVTARELPSYADRNFRLEDRSGWCSVLKISHQEQREEADLQNRALMHLELEAPPLPVPRVRHTRGGESLWELDDELGRPCVARVLTFLPGQLMGRLDHYPEGLLESLGRLLAELDRGLSSFRHPATQRAFEWDLAQAAPVGDRVAAIESAEDRALASDFFLQYRAHVLPRLSGLRRNVLHNDANPYNVLVDEQNEICGLIDFGDLVLTPLVCEPAIAAAYAMMEQADPIDAACRLVAGYHQVMPLTAEEVELIYPLVGGRLATSVTKAAESARAEPDNEYIGITAAPAWELLRRLREIPHREATDALRAACGLPSEKRSRRKSGELAETRSRVIAPSFSLAYQEPLQITRGEGQYLFDAEGRAYLDCVNNVCHVGHCHPRVVDAAQRQTERLNTNTRYLYSGLTDYAERLTAKLPEPLSVCFFVCTGSEANDLALRLARTHTGAHAVVTLEGAYHGHTGNLIEISPYKFDAPGGAGRVDHVQVAASPDPYRGAHRRDDPKAGERFAESVADAADRAARQGGLAAFIAEPFLGCGGQVEPPPGYLEAAYRHVRERGGVCIADEVQVGFGRVGTHFWAFETQGVVPDIVTLGKPIGNGHPMAAVVTTPQIAASFDNGMEYFNTFGGNPVSCAVGLAVLDVVEEEGLQAHAERLGAVLKQSVSELAERHPLLGDVRGRGLFLGFELVRDRSTREPADREASAVVEQLKREGILLSIDGPLHNVLKFKPPMVFTEHDAHGLVDALDRALATL